MVEFYAERTGEFEGRLQGVDFTIDGREVGLYFVEPGDFCGELGLFDDGPQPEYVIALTASVVVYVPAAELREIMLKTPDVMNVLGGKLAARVRQMTYQRSLLGLPNIAQRVCCQLWMLVPALGAVMVLAVFMLGLQRENSTILPSALLNKPVPEFEIEPLR